jgi:hypothetical protein
VCERTSDALVCERLDATVEGDARRGRHRCQLGVCLRPRGGLLGQQLGVAAGTPVVEKRVARRYKLKSDLADVAASPRPARVGNGDGARLIDPLEQKRPVADQRSGVRQSSPSVATAFRGHGYSHGWAKMYGK